MKRWWDGRKPVEDATERGGFRKDKELEREKLAPIKNEWGGVGATSLVCAPPPPLHLSSFPPCVLCMLRVVRGLGAFTLTSTHFRATEQGTTDCLERARASTDHTMHFPERAVLRDLYATVNLR